MNDGSLAESLIEQVIALLFTSNSRYILRKFDSTKLSKSLSTVNVDGGLLSCERALGVIWIVENDKLGFKISIVDKPCTKRNILSVIFSVYYPCFLISPAIVNAKKLFQEEGC